MMTNKTLFVTGLGSQEKFDNVTLLLSDYNLHKLISALSEAMTQYRDQEPPSRVCVTLYGALKDGDGNRMTTPIVMTKRTYQCPRCKCDFAEQEIDMMDGTLMEESISCPACDYNFQFTTGTYRILLPFQWSYRSTPRNRAIQRALENAEKALDEAELLNNEEG